jgi:hypothetical protein
MTSSAMRTFWGMDSGVGFARLKLGDEGAMDET